MLRPLYATKFLCFVYLHYTYTFGSLPGVSLYTMVTYAVVSCSTLIRSIVHTRYLTRWLSTLFQIRSVAYTVVYSTGVS